MVALNCLKKKLLINLVKKYPNVESPNFRCEAGSIR